MFVSSAWTRNHRRHPVNHLQIKLWKTAGRGLCTMSDSDAKWLPPGITPLFWLLGLHREGWVFNGVGEDTEEVKMNIVELWSHFNQIALGFLFKKLDFRPSVSLVWPPLSPGPFIWKIHVRESVFIFSVMLFLFPSPCLNLLWSMEAYFLFLSHTLQPWVIPFSLSWLNRTYFLFFLFFEFHVYIIALIFKQPCKAGSLTAF